MVHLTLISENVHFDNCFSITPSLAELEMFLRIPGYVSTENSYWRKARFLCASADLRRLFILQTRVVIVLVYC